MESLIETSFQNLNADCINLIILNLCYLDGLAAKYTCKHLHLSVSAIHFEPERIIRKYMSKYGLIYENFRIRTSENFYVFGGFMFGLVLDKHFDCSDIDMVHFTKMNDSTISPVEKITLRRGRENQWQHDYYDCLKTIDPERQQYEDFSYPLNLIKTDGSSSDGIRYQHLTLLKPCKSIGKYIDLTSDLEVTKIYYDGETIKFSNIWGMFERKCTYDINKAYVKSMYCYGCPLSDAPSFCNMHDRLRERVEKYHNRGISITMIDDRTPKRQLKEIYDIYGIDIDPPTKMRYACEGRGRVPDALIISRKFKREVINKYGLIVGEKITTTPDHWGKLTLRCDLTVFHISHGFPADKDRYIKCITSIFHCDDSSEDFDY